MSTLFGWVVALRADVVDPSLGRLEAEKREEYASACDAVSNGHKEGVAGKVSLDARSRAKGKDGAQCYLLLRPWSLRGLVFVYFDGESSRSLDRLDLRDWISGGDPMSKQNWQSRGDRDDE